MPTPIPEWDQPRVLIRYLINRQLERIPTTVKQASSRVGLGAENIYSILNAQGVEFDLIQTTEVRKIAGLQIVIRLLPEHFINLYKVDRSQWQASYDYLINRDIEIEPEPDWRAIQQRRRKKIKMEKMRYFLREDTE